MDIGKKIIELREKKGWTQYRLYKEAKIGQSTLSQIESGVKKSPNSDTLQKIATALGVSMAEFDETPLPEHAKQLTDKFITAMDSEEKTPLEQQAADIFKSMSPEEQQKMLMPFFKQTSANTYEIDENLLLDEFKRLSIESQQAIATIIRNLVSAQK
ncbi:hypothetical protein SPSIL_014760 [Sporomusa silvacetica DSM 10669]|uniref:HTH cro/C1-type domain-containing protein n=1 Tax=Sporomusa silvacetica DSM 10669 TaxID=1123289 RepID=A0ABZ3II61_9FIRM|nr:helix-turn-helix transcriptional regulator [Sporomusa silvacetica]OZC21538.1 DNA-binding transcriptional repressor PuuR [Sporomusa silvacetica DSM 10669]